VEKEEEPLKETYSVSILVGYFLLDSLSALAVLSRVSEIFSLTESHQRADIALFLKN
jgi:hypothetical protein